MAQTGVYRRGKTWWIRYSADGKQYREPAKGLTRQQAIELRASRVVEVANGVIVKPQDRKTRWPKLRELMERHYRQKASHSRAMRAIAHLERHLGKMAIRNITYDRLLRYRDDRMDEGAAPASILYEVRTLRKGFTIAKKAGKIEHIPPMPEIEVNNARTGFFEREDFDAMIAEMESGKTHPSVVALMKLMYLTGWRKAVAGNRKWNEHVDMKRGLLKITRGEKQHKNKKGFTFPFAAIPELAEVFQQQWEYTKQVQKRTGQIVPWVFHREGEPIKNFRLAWQGACERAEIEGIPHDMRRTAVRNMRRQGIPTQVIKALVGILTDSIFERYDIIDESDLVSAVKQYAAGMAAENDGKVLPMRKRKRA